MRFLEPGVLNSALIKKKGHRDVFFDTMQDLGPVGDRLAYFLDFLETKELDMP